MVRSVAQTWLESAFLDSFGNLVSFRSCHLIFIIGGRSDAANEAVALFNMPENAARLKGPELECELLTHALIVASSNTHVSFAAGANDIGKFFMLIIPISTELLGKVRTGKKKCKSSPLV